MKAGCADVLQNAPSAEPLFVYEKAASLTSEDIIKASLEFSECPVNSKEAQDVFAQYKILQNQVTSSAFMNLSEAERAEKILEQMYSDVLSSYQEMQSKTSEMFFSGRYNCVSSSVLYLALAKAASLDVRGQRTPLHAFCTVYIKDGSGGNLTKIDVETTNPMGFNPGTKKNLQANTTGNKKYAVVPKKNYSGRKEISDRLFVSLIGRNMATEYDRKGEYFSSVPMSAACLSFVKDESASVSFARDDFEKICGNYVVSLHREKNFEKALAWLDYVYGKYGAEGVLRDSYETTVYNNVVSLCKKGQFDAARECYKVRASRLSKRRIAQIENNIFNEEIKWNLEACRSDDAAISYLEGIKSSASLDSAATKKIDSYLEHYWINKINAVQKLEGFLKAAGVAQNAIDAMPKSAALKNAKAMCLRNYDTEFHNRFAAFANNKQYQEALNVLNEGLQGNPQSSILNNDLNKLDRLMQSQTGK